MLYNRKNYEQGFGAAIVAIAMLVLVVLFVLVALGNANDTMKVVWGAACDIAEGCN